MIYYISSRHPGKWHDSRVLRSSTLWTAMENGNRAFPGAVFLADSAYPLRDWLIPPFKGEVEGAKRAFNRAHRKTRCSVERCIGELKNRFFSLKTGLRVQTIELSAKLIQCAAILHNAAKLQGDSWEYDDEEQQGQEEDEEEEQEEQEHGNRRQQLLQTFA